MNITWSEMGQQNRQAKKVYCDWLRANKFVIDLRFTTDEEAAASNRLSFSEFCAQSFGSKDQVCDTVSSIFYNAIFWACFRDFLYKKKG